MILYTIGYGNGRALLKDRLPQDRTVLVVDVRRTTGAWCAAYTGPNLKRILETFGHAYLHMAALGNYGATSTEWVRHHGADAALDCIAKIIRDGRTVVLLCAEGDAQKCHRRFVAEALVERVPGLTVTHL
jgi:uncharacterized protein (DUF488 family)